MSVQKRLLVVIAAFTAFYGAIIGKAFYYQVVGDEGIEKYSLSQYEKEIVIPPARGAILDRNGNELAITINTFSVGATPAMIGDKRGFAAVAEKVLKVSREKVRKSLSSKKAFVYVKRQASRESALSFVEELGRLKEFKREYERYGRVGVVSLIPEPKRYYPGKELAANVLGFCNIDSVGMEGVEKAFDKYLVGRKVTLTCERDAKGRLMIPEVIADQDSLGHTLQLTLDKNIQFICEREIAEGVKQFNARGGMAVVMSPVTGEVFAMAVYPSFDPNRAGKFPPRLRRNRVITDIYEPGSTFKVFLLSGALESGRVSVTDCVYCENGVYRVQRRYIHDTHKSEWLTVPEVIKYSSNIGAVKIVEKMTAEKYHEYIKRFAFGSKTGIELIGEIPGIIPSRKDFMKPIRYATASFGQGIAATPLQVINAFCSVVNGGVALRPYIIKEVRDRFGKIVYRGKPLYSGRIISGATSAAMRAILKDVVTEEGTGTLASLSGYSVGGKTGTSQKVDFDRGGYSDKRIASFMGFFPVNEPSLAILVLIDEPEDEVYGGLVAAPIFSKIASKVAIYAGIAPDSVEEENRKVAKNERGEGERGQVNPGRGKLPVMKVSLAGDGEGRFVMPDLEGLTVAQVVDMMETIPVEVTLNGSGVVVKQHPPAGEGVSAGKRCVITFGEE